MVAIVAYLFQEEHSNVNCPSTSVPQGDGFQDDSSSRSLLVESKSVKLEIVGQVKPYEEADFTFHPKSKFTGPVVIFLHLYFPPESKRTGSELPPPPSLPPNILVMAVEVAQSTAPVSTTSTTDPMLRRRSESLNKATACLRDFRNVAFVTVAISLGVPVRKHWQD